jgi:NTP pyrophosphatase (non-canonical NTP hydrolase)
MNIKSIALLVHELATRNGFHDGQVPGSREEVASFVANIHGEVSELWEAFRRGTLNKQCDKPALLTCLEEELADIIIRCLDTAAEHGIDIERAIIVKHEYNCTRPFKHGGKLA